MGRTGKRYRAHKSCGEAVLGFMPLPLSRLRLTEQNLAKSGVTRRPGNALSWCVKAIGCSQGAQVSGPESIEKARLLKWAPTLS